MNQNTLPKILNDSTVTIVMSPSEQKRWIHFAGQNGMLLQAKLVTPRDLFLSPSLTEIAIAMEILEVNANEALNALMLLPWIQNMEISTLTSKRLQSLHRLIHHVSMKIHPFNTSLLQYSPSIPKPLPQAESCFISPNPTNEVIHTIESQDERNMIRDVISLILSDLENGILPHQIAIVHASHEQIRVLKRYFEDANIPVSFEQKVKLSSFPIFHRFLQNLRLHGFAEAVLELQSARPMFTLEEETAFGVFASLCNQFEDDEYIAHAAILSEWLEEVDVNIPSTIRGLQMTTQSMINNAELNRIYVLAPVSNMFASKHPSFLRDDEKQEIGYPISFDEEKAAQYDFELFLESTRHITLCFALRLEGKEIDPYFPHTKRQFKERAIPNLDWRRFPSLRRLNHPSPHKRYRHDFQGISVELMNTWRSKGISLSATSLDTFSLCRFQFLLTHFMKLAPFKTTYPLFWGNVAHEVLQLDAKNQVVNLSEILSKHWNEFPTEEAEKWNVFLPLMTERLSQMQSDIHTIRHLSSFSTGPSELSLSVPLTLEEDFHLHGKIDQIFVLESEKNYLILVDYKSGSTKYVADAVLQLEQAQLPIYASLLRKQPLSSRDQILGLFYQPIDTASSKKNHDPDKRLTTYAYDGVIINEPDLIAQFAPDALLKGITHVNDGSLKKSPKRILSVPDFESWIEEVDLMLQEVISNIKSRDFAINPKAIIPGKSVSQSCEYCPYSAICHGKNSPSEVEEELRGDEDEA